MGRPKQWLTVSKWVELACKLNIRHQWRHNVKWFYKQCTLCGKVRVSDRTDVGDERRPFIVPE